MSQAFDAVRAMQAKQSKNLQVLNISRSKNVAFQKESDNCNHENAAKLVGLGMRLEIAPKSAGFVVCEIIPGFAAFCSKKVTVGDVIQ